MNNFILTCGSTADLGVEYAKERDIAVLPFKFMLGDIDHLDDGKEISNTKVYEILSKGVVGKTSQVTSSEYEEFFTPYLEKGLDVIHVTLSSGLSGTYESCLTAKKNLEEKFPQRKVYVIDSLSGSRGQGMIVTTVADLRDQGLSAEEIVTKVEEEKLYFNALYFAPDLSTFIRGGRLSAAAGFVGTILKIVPLLTVDAAGKLVVKKKLIGKRRATAELVSEMVKTADGGKNYSGECVVCHANALEDAKITVSEIEKEMPALAGKIKISEIGATMGCHCGPGTIAVFYIGEKRI